MNIAAITAMHAASSIALATEPIVAPVVPWSAPSCWRGTSRSAVAERRVTLRNLDCFAALTTPAAAPWCGAVADLAQTLRR